MDEVRLPRIPVECRLHHPWAPGTAEMSWEKCECGPAQSTRGGHIVVRCLHPGCHEEWMAPRHTRDHLRGPLGHHRPGYR